VTYLRKALGVHGGTKVLLGVVWTTEEALRYSNAFPERILIDTTYKSNIEQRALFVATGITSCNKSFISLQTSEVREQYIQKKVSASVFFVSFFLGGGFVFTLLFLVILLGAISSDSLLCCFCQRASALQRES